MQIECIIRVLGVSVILAGATLAQTLSGDVAQQSERPVHSFEYLRGEIEHHNPSAIAEAGQSGNRAFVPYLREQLRKRKFERYPEESNALRRALAKLGEVDQLQAELCYQRVWPNSEGLRYVGGWFAINEAQKMLSADWNYPSGPDYLGRPVSRWIGRDVAMTPPSWTALGALPGLVPDPPPTPTLTLPLLMKSASLVSMWQEWIEAHRTELMRLKPGVEGLDLSSTGCKKAPKEPKAPAAK